VSYHDTDAIWKEGRETGFTEGVQAKRERCLEWMRCLVDIGGDIAYGELEAVIVSGEEPPKEEPCKK